MNTFTYEVRYQIGAYSGSVRVLADEDADYDHIIALAKKELRRRAGPLPAGPIAESWKVVRP